MRTITMPAIAAGALLLLGQGALGQATGPADPPRPEAAGVFTIHEAAAVVESVDPQAGHVLLRLPDDTLVTLKVGPQVRNIAQLKPGDRVAARYTEAAVVRLARTGASSAAASPQPGGTAAGAPAGQPGPVTSGQVEERTTVRGIDRANNTVTFMGPDNVTRTTVARDPASTQALQTLNVGDPIDVTYVEGVAISLEPLRG
ncbi:MAG TPA: hypothetical protein VE684_05620 [Crenalkalicoccus sp.]|jgi:hypothetical protein|nr:hypothetical protein [Crenalkalicoccus sp.]